MKTLYKTNLLILFQLVTLLSLGQNSLFRAKVIVPEIGIVGGGVIIFPKIRDTVEMNEDGVVKVDLTVGENRLFYIRWSGWNTQIFRFENGECDTALLTAIVPDTSYYQRFYSKKVCPICLQSRSVLPITYQMPTPKMMKKANRGKMYLGGCVVYDYSPHFYCKKDEFEF